VYKIAVLDDDKTWNTAIKRFLSRHGFDVQLFQTVAEFLQEAQYCDLALIDFYLSANPDALHDMNGYALIRQLKKSLTDCPLLILVSAFADMESTRLFPEADLFLVKDIGLSLILQRLNQLLAGRPAKQKALIVASLS
jgi:DNA-binding response OmpR family regulator